MEQTQVVGIGFTATPLHLPDMAGTAESIFAQAVAYCAQKMGPDSSQDVVDRLKQGDGTACKYCHYSVAVQVAEFLGTWDENVKAAYTYDYDATPEDLCFGETSQTLPIHMIVWVDHKTGALNSLVTALDCALGQCYADLMSMSRVAYLLDVQVVDDTDVKSRVGYGALLSSIHNRPIRVWKR
jgi:hypothetical protein